MSHGPTALAWGGVRGKAGLVSEFTQSASTSRMWGGCTVPSPAISAQRVHACNALAVIKYPRIRWAKVDEPRSPQAFQTGGLGVTRVVVIGRIVWGIPRCMRYHPRSRFQRAGDACLRLLRGEHTRHLIGSTKGAHRALRRRISGTRFRYDCFCDRIRTGQKVVIFSALRVPPSRDQDTLLLELTTSIELWDSREPGSDRLVIRCCLQCLATET